MTWQVRSFYSAPLATGLKVLALQSAWWDGFNFYLWFSDDLGAPMRACRRRRVVVGLSRSAADAVQFLDDELSASEKIGERVIIIGSAICTRCGGFRLR